MTNPKYLTPQQVAKKLGVHYNTVHRWLHAGKLESYQPTGWHGIYRISQEQLKSFMEATK